MAKYNPTDQRDRLFFLAAAFIWSALTSLLMVVVMGGLLWGFLLKPLSCR